MLCLLSEWQYYCSRPPFLPNHQQMLDKFSTENIFLFESEYELTDVRSMPGRHGGLQEVIRSKASHAMWTHCTIHRKTLPSNLVLILVMDIVNYIWTDQWRTEYKKNLHGHVSWTHIPGIFTTVHDGFYILRFTFEQDQKIQFPTRGMSCKLQILCRFRRLLLFAVMCTSIKYYSRLWVTCGWKNNEESDQFCFPEFDKYASPNKLIVFQDFPTCLTEYLLKVREKIRETFVDLKSFPCSKASTDSLDKKSIFLLRQLHWIKIHLFRFARVLDK